MYLTALRLDGFRNIKNQEIFPCDGVNVIFGNNAQGKTNLIEAIFFCSGLGSFRGAKEAELIPFGQDFLSLSADFFSKGRNRKTEIKISREKKKILLSGVPQKRLSSLCGEFGCVVFFPDDLSLIKSAPENRRKFLDTALCTLKPGYRKLLLNYKRALSQKNFLLKTAFKYDKETADALLDGYDRHIAKFGSVICGQRKIYTEKISVFADGFFSGLSSGKESLSLCYDGSDFAGEDGEQKLFCELLSSREQSLKTLSTPVGPHRNDLIVDINGISAKSFGSQGQQRSAAIALKLAEAAVLREYSGEQPIILLDDVMSELDFGRQEYILNSLKEGQVFITCCDPKQISGLKSGKAFLTENGRFEETDI